MKLIVAAAVALGRQADAGGMLPAALECSLVDYIAQAFAGEYLKVQVDLDGPERYVLVYPTRDVPAGEIRRRELTATRLRSLP